MEQNELDELQAYINKYFSNKKITTMATEAKKHLKEDEQSEETFYAAQNTVTGQWLKDIYDQQDFVWIDWDEESENDERAWSPTEANVDGFINRLNIPDVKVFGQGGNHPPRPPLSA